MRRRWWFGALLLALAGCVSTPPVVGNSAPALKDERQEAAYHQVLERHSGRDEIFKGFDTVLFATATLQTDAFREARLYRQGLFKALSQERVRENLAREIAEAAGTHELFLGVYVYDYHYDDFDRPGSVWNVELVTPAGAVRPLSVERLGRADMEMRAYYPYTGVFWVGYRLRFPSLFSNGSLVIPASTEWVLLRLASTLGKAELRMQVR
ncbi:MAG: hypothetical protein ABW123_25150 [Cystobacter sp.]